LRDIAAAASRVRETFVLDVVELVQESGTNSKLKQRLEQMREQIAHISSQQRASASSTSSSSSPPSSSRQPAKANSLGKKGPGFQSPKNAATDSGNTPSTEQAMSTNDTSGSSSSSSGSAKSKSNNNEISSSDVEKNDSSSRGKKALLLLPNATLLHVFSFLETPDILATAQVMKWLSQPSRPLFSPALILARFSTFFYILSVLFLFSLSSCD
jgi:hypothetical protein